MMMIIIIVIIIMIMIIIVLIIIMIMGIAVLLERFYTSLTLLPPGLLLVSLAAFEIVTGFTASTLDPVQAAVITFDVVNGYVGFLDFCMQSVNTAVALA